MSKRWIHLYVIKEELHETSATWKGQGLSLLNIKDTNKGFTFTVSQSEIPQRFSGEN